jgi:hypothetical protein
MTISHREFHQAANRARPGFRERLPKRKPSVPERHARKCVVCLHPKRAEIESAFLQWRSPKFIAVQYSLAGTHNIYRHAHATGLFALRRFKLLCAAERIAERFNRPGFDILADAVIRAVEVCSQVDARGVPRGTRSRVVISLGATGHTAIPGSVAPNPVSLGLSARRGATYIHSSPSGPGPLIGDALVDSMEIQSASAPVASIEGLPPGFIPEMLAGLEKPRND